MFHERMMDLLGDGKMPADCICGGNRMHFSNCAIGKLEALKEKVKDFADADYAHAAQGGGIYFSADHLRGSAAAYSDMVKHIEQAIREARSATSGVTPRENLIVGCERPQPHTHIPDSVKCVPTSGDKVTGERTCWECEREDYNYRCPTHKEMSPVPEESGLRAENERLRGALLHATRRQHPYLPDGEDACGGCEKARAALSPAEPTAAPKGEPPKGTCALCGGSMPKGEEMFKFHGYSGPCPAPEPPVQGEEEK